MGWGLRPHPYPTFPAYTTQKFGFFFFGFHFFFFFLKNPKTRKPGFENPETRPNLTPEFSVLQPTYNRYPSQQVRPYHFIVLLQTNGAKVLYLLLFLFPKWRKHCAQGSPRQLLFLSLLSSPPIIPTYYCSFFNLPSFTPPVRATVGEVRYSIEIDVGGE